MVDINKVSENIHYQLIPQQDNESEGWDVRLLEGPHPETVIDMVQFPLMERMTKCVGTWRLFQHPMKI